LRRSDSAYEKQVEILKNRLEGAKKILREKSDRTTELQNELDQIKIDLYPVLMNQVRNYAERTVHEEMSMAVLFLDLKGFSGLNMIEAVESVQIVRSQAASLLSHRDGQHPNTWGDAVVAAFENPNDGLECAHKLLRHLEVDNLTARIGMSHGELTISYNAVRDALDIDGPAMTEGARLEPMADPGEVLISKSLRFHPDVEEDRFLFTTQHRTPEKSFGAHKMDQVIECYSVQLRQEANA